MPITHFYPTLLSVHELGTKIYSSLYDLGKTYGTDVSHELTTQFAALFDQLERFAAENDGGKIRLLEERHLLALEQLDVLRQETADLCKGFDRDINYAATQWQQEADNLHHSISKLEKKKQALSRKVHDQISSLQLSCPRESSDVIRAEDEYVHEVSETISKLEHQLTTKENNLLQSHEELDHGILDLEAVTDMIEKEEQKNSILIRKTTTLTDELSAIKGYRERLQCRLNSFDQKLAA